MRKPRSRQLASNTAVHQLHRFQPRTQLQSMVTVEMTMPGPMAGPQREKVSFGSTIAKYHREGLFGTGCGLVCFGLMPFWTALNGRLVWKQAFDEIAMAVAAVFGLLGIAAVALSCLVVPERMTIVLIRALKVPLLVVTAAAAIMVYSLAARNELAATWRIQSLVNFDKIREDAFERKMNDLFCHAQAIHVCENESIATAQSMFDLAHWPSDSTKSIKSACSTFNDSVRKWRMPLEHEICQVCQTVKREEVNAHDSHVAMATVPHPNKAAVTWCGDYLITHKANPPTEDSPYRQHRYDFLQLWEDKAPYTLLYGAQLLSILVCFAVLAIAILRWWESNQTMAVSDSTSAPIFHL